MIELLYPNFLLLIVVLILIYLFHYKIGFKRESVMRFSDIKLIPESYISSAKYKIRLILLIKFIIFLLAIIALSRPRKTNVVTNSKIEIVDIMLVIDMSSSMLAQDFKPNRLEAAKEVAKSFVNDRSGDRLGIIIFAGESFIQCPLTIDKTVLASLVNEIEVASKEYDGTAIGMAIANGTNRLRNSNVDSKVMILLSDGSNNSGEIDPITAAELAAQFNVKIYTIGAGTNQSYTRIPGRGLIRNEIDEETLIQIAKVTGGRYFRATDIAALESIYSEISSLERSEIEVNEYTQYTELYGWFLIPAFILGMGMEVTRRSIFRMIT